MEYRQISVNKNLIIFRQDSVPKDAVPPPGPNALPTRLCMYVGTLKTRLC